MIEFIVIYILGVVVSVGGLALYGRTKSKLSFTVVDSILCLIWPVAWVIFFLALLLGIVYGAGRALSRDRTND